MDSETKDRISAYFESNREELKNEFVELLSQFVACRTVNVVSSRLDEFPYLKERGEESRVVALVESWAEREGFEHETHARIPERGNIILHYGEKNGPALFVPGHTDVVPPGDGWDSDPFELKIDGDTVRARGVADDKGPLVASLLALKIVKNAGIRIAGDFQVAALADEEAMGEDGVDFGMIYLLEGGMVKADMAIVPDIGGNMRKIDIAEKGIINYGIKTVGRQAHGSTPERGINAINAMAEYLMRLREHNFDYKKHPVLGDYSVNVGMIQGGAAPNIVPGSCTAVVDIRIVPGQSVEGVRTELQQLAAGLECEFMVTVKSQMAAHEISPDSELIRVVSDATEAVCGTRPQTMGLGGGTYAKFLNHAGIEAIGFAPGDHDAMHMANEYASISEHLQYAHTLALAAAELTLC